MSGTDRRSFLKMAAAGTLASTVLPQAPAEAAAPAVPDSDRPWQALLGRSLPGELDYAPRIEGRLPAGLHGSLYRNGPGLFERGGYRKRNLLDGDGLIQAFDISEKGVRYRTRFVETEKFTDSPSPSLYWP